MRTFIKVAALLAPGIIASAFTTDHDAPRHLRLLRAEPAADTTVTSTPAEIRLFFSQEPVLRATSVRLLAADESAIELAEPALDAKDATVVNAAVKAALEPGIYTVNWRTISPDGHVVRGDLRFTYRAADDLAGLLRRAEDG